MKKIKEFFNKFKEKGEKDKTFSIVSAVVFIIVLIFTYRMIISPITHKIGDMIEEKNTGIAKKDEHGCLRMEKYYWCESKKRCIKSEEGCHLSRDQKEEYVKDHLIKNLYKLIPGEEVGGRFLIWSFGFNEYDKVAIKYGNEFVQYFAEIDFFIHQDGGVDIKEFEIISEEIVKTIPLD